MSENQGGTVEGTTEEIRTLLGAWALDAVDDHERVAVERAIAADSALAAEASDLREAVARIAEHDATAPPPAVRHRVLAEIIDTVQLPTDQSASRSRSDSDDASDDLASARRRRDVRRSNSGGRILAAAAAAVIAIAIPTVIAVNQADRAERAESQVAHLADALTRPDAALVDADLVGGGRAVAVLADGVAVLAAADLPELTDQDYQLWVVDEDGAVSAGVLSWQDGQLTAQVDDFPGDAALAITAEPLGGSEQPTSDPLVVLSRG